MKTKLKTIIFLLPSTLAFLSYNSFAINEVKPVDKKEVVVSASEDEDLEQNLGKISQLKSKLEIIKLQRSIEKEQNDTSSNNDYNNYNNYNNNQGYNNYQQNYNSQPEPIHQINEHETSNGIINNNANNIQTTEIIPVNDMKAIAVYGLGNMSYAEILVNGGKVVVRNGETLSNGYKVVSLSNIGVVLSKDNNKITLPITASTLQ